MNRITRIVWSCVALLALAVGSPQVFHLFAFAEQTQRPSFEVASIKPGDPNGRPRGFTTRGNIFIVMNSSLKEMIGFAYDIQLYLIVGGPKWIDSDVFTIEAKPSAATPLLPDSPGTLNLQKVMLQSLMEERFKLVVHRETRMEPIYELVVAKGGPKLKETPDPNAKGHLLGGGRGLRNWDAINVGIAGVVGLLSSDLGRPVRDKTGLSGKYDFKLTYTSEPTQQVLGAPPPEAVPPVDSNAPSIYTALQEQLGLKLESARGPVEVLIIDQAQRPTEN